MSEVKNIPEGWEETTLGEICTPKGGKRLPKGMTLVNYKTDHPYIRITDFNGNKINKNQLQFVTEDVFKHISRYIVNENDIIITIVGTVGLIAKIDNELNNASLTENCVKLVELKNIDSEYLYYFLTSKNGQDEINKNSVGAVQKKLPIYGVQNIKIELPKDINEQKSIASILIAFDNKIELLEAQNKTLEETAQTIFAEWFNKYKNGDELPEGLQIDSLEKIANHSKTNVKPFDNPDTEYYHYSLPSYDNGLIPVIEKGDVIKSNKYLVENNSFLVSKLNPFTPRIWTIFDAKQNFICSTEFQVVKPKEELYFSLIHCFLNSDEFTSELSQKIKGTSSSHQRVNPQDIFDVELVIPCENELMKFNSAIYPLLAKKNINHKQIQTLTKTRDELLPRLMSGEVRVKKQFIENFE